MEGGRGGVGVLNEKPHRETLASHVALRQTEYASDPVVQNSPVSDTNQQ